VHHLQDSNGSSSPADDDSTKKIDRSALLKEIRQLHADVDSDVLACWKKTLPKMIRLGEALTALKDDVDRGQWISWFEANQRYLGFGKDTEENYRKLYKHRDRLADSNSEPARNLTDALLLIKEPDPEKRRALLRESQETGKSIRANQSRKKKQKPKQYYRLHTVDGDIVYLDYESFSLDCPDERGTRAPDEYTLIVEKNRRSEHITEAEAALGTKCVWVEVYWDSDDRWLEVEDSADPDAPEKRDPGLQKLAVNALCVMGIPKREAAKLVKDADGETEGDLLASALRIHRGAKPPGQLPAPAPQPKSPATEPDPVSAQEDETEDVFDAVQAKLNEAAQIAKKGKLDEGFFLCMAGASFRSASASGRHPHDVTREF
jgi:hypothetical protein